MNDSQPTTFAPVPNWLLHRPEVSPGAKLAYARLKQYGGRNGTAWPSLTTLGREVGVSRRQAKRYVAELRALKLITSARTGEHASNSYRLLAHPWATATTGDKHGPTSKDNDDPAKGTGTALSPGTVATPKKISAEEIHEESAATSSQKRKRRERWQIESDRQSVKDQMQRIRSTEVAYDRQKMNDVLKPEGRAKLGKLNKRLQELEDELLNA